jgi:hypothetical protein
MLVNYLFLTVNQKSSLIIIKTPFSFSIAFAVNTSFLYCLFGNTVWAIAVGYYIYILFLGFSGMNKNLARFEYYFRLF